MNRLIKKVLKTPPWCNGFTIWNAGKQGRKFFRDLPLDLKGHVEYFCDVDLSKCYNSKITGRLLYKCKF